MVKGTTSAPGRYVPIKSPNLWTRKIIKGKGKDKKIHTYWMASWHQNGKTKNVHIGLASMDKEEALKKALALKTAALSTEYMLVPAVDIEAIKAAREKLIAEAIVGLKADPDSKYVCDNCGADFEVTPREANFCPACGCSTKLRRMNGELTTWQKILYGSREGTPQAMPAYKHTQGSSWRLKQRQAMPLDQKVRLSKKRIEEWCNAYGYEVYVSFSGGKDSTVLLDLVRSVYKNCPAVFIDTGVEYPEIRRFAKSQKNVVVLKPKMHFKEIIDKYGYPVVSKRVSRFVQDIRSDPERNPATQNLRLTGYTRAGNYCPNMRLPERWRFLIEAPFKISDRCCEILKEGPLGRYMKETGKKPITGEMAVDSQNRRWAYLQTGCNAFSQRNPKSRPMGFWTGQDVLRYIKEKNVPYCSEVYGDIVEEDGVLHCTKASHTGCMFCGFGAQRDKNDRFEQLRLQHPKLYDYGMNKLGMLEVIDYVNYHVSRPEGHVRLNHVVFAHIKLYILNVV